MQLLERGYRSNGALVSFLFYFFVPLTMFSGVLFHFCLGPFKGEKYFSLFPSEAGGFPWVAEVIGRDTENAPALDNDMSG